MPFPSFRYASLTTKMLVFGGLILLLTGGGYVTYKQVATKNAPMTEVAQPDTTSQTDSTTQPQTTTNQTKKQTKKKQKTTQSGTSTTQTSSNTSGGSSGGSSSGGSSGGSSSCSSNQIGTYPNCYPKPPASASSGKSWKLAFHEEFSGSDYDHNKLTPCFDWNYGNCTKTFNKGREVYKPGQVKVSGGAAHLIAEPMSPPISDSGCYNNSCTYKAGLLSTARPNADTGSYLFPFTYGYVESRMKYPDVSGFFTAFWMLPTDPSYNYTNEIDIVEILGGDPKTIFMTYHYNNRSEYHAVNSGDLNNGACAVKNYSTDWVKFGLDWQADHIAWYINGVKCGQYTGADIYNGPMQLILHMMIDNQWERDWGLTLANQSLVDELTVDYIRIYQQH